jgi:hypothetical protein
MLQQPAFVGGLFIGLLSALPVVSAANLCCCLWVIGGGVVAAYVDAQNTRANLPVSRGALDGLLAGVAGALIWLIVAIPLDLMLAPLQRQLAEAMAARSESMPPEAREWFELIAARSSSPGRWALGFFFQLFVGLVFAPIGGMLGAVFFKKDLPPALGGTPAPPPLP